MVFETFDLNKKIDLLTNNNSTLNKLNLGAGDDIRKGWVNHDQVQSPGIDHVFDLNKAPYPLEDETFDLVLASHVLEHVNPIFPCIEEIYRIIKSGGLFVIRVPHYASNCCYGDLSHVRATGYQTFQHLADDEYCRLYGLSKWKNTEFCKLLFVKKWYYPWNFIMEPLASLKPIYYENILANIFTPYETVTILRK